jgi:hypothetical protein
VESPVTEDREEEYMFNQPKITKVINRPTVIQSMWFVIL